MTQTSLELSKDDHSTEIVLGIVQGQPYERLHKTSHIQASQSFIIGIIWNIFCSKKNHAIVFHLDLTKTKYWHVQEIRFKISWHFEYLCKFYSNDGVPMTSYGWLVAMIDWAWFVLISWSWFLAHMCWLYAHLKYIVPYLLFFS